MLLVLTELCLFMKVLACLKFMLQCQAGNGNLQVTTKIDYDRLKEPGANFIKLCWPQGCVKQSAVSILKNSVYLRAV